MSIPQQLRKPLPGVSVPQVEVSTTPLELRYRALGTGRPNPVLDNKWACRVLNVSVATLGLLVATPLMMVIALAISLTSRGPVIFRQHRVGLDRRGRGVDHSLKSRRRVDAGGRVFTIYKFRTMQSDSRRRGEVWAARNDSRVTTVGRFLRATRLDELPQFVNVLKGDMSIVGPRPEQPRIFQRLDGELTGYRRRQKVLPGITGLAQVELGYDTDLDGVRRKVELDLEYIRGRSAVRDLAIMARTVPVMVFRKVWM